MPSRSIGPSRVQCKNHRTAVIALLQRIADQPQPRTEPLLFLCRVVGGSEQAGDFIFRPDAVGAVDPLDQRARAEIEALGAAIKTGAVAAAPREFEHASSCCRRADA